MSAPPQNPDTEQPEYDTSMDRFLDIHPTDRDAPRLNRQWLSGRSRDELIDIILELKSRLPKPTAKLEADVVSSAVGTPVSGEQEVVEEFIRMPAVPVRHREDTVDISWRIVLRSSNPKHKALGLEITDDTFVGRAAAGITPDLDLTMYDAESLGVSRQHALFRPGRTNLLLIDLGSTNGTYRNGKQLDAGIAQTLQDKDTITFATLHFTVRFVSRPH